MFLFCPLNERWLWAWQVRITSICSSKARQLHIHGCSIIKDYDFIGVFLQLMVIFWMLSTCAPTGIISILIKKKCSWPEALRFMEWKFIHVGRLCMPLRFTSTGWFPVWQQLGQGPKMMPKHSRFISHWMVFKKNNLSINRVSSEDWLFIGECGKLYS